MAVWLPLEVMAVGPLLGEGSVAALNRPGKNGRAVSPTGRCDGGVRNSSGASAVSPSHSLQPESLQEMDRLVSSSRNLLKTMETSPHEKALSLHCPLGSCMR